MSTQKQPKLRLPANIPQPPAPPDGFRWKVLGWGKPENNFMGEKVAAFEILNWRVLNTWRGNDKQYFYLLAVPLTAKPARKVKRVKARVMYACYMGDSLYSIEKKREDAEYHLSDTPSVVRDPKNHVARVAVIDLSNPEQLVEQAESAVLDLPAQASAWDIARAVLASLGLVLPTAKKKGGK